MKQMKCGCQKNHDITYDKNLYMMQTKKFFVHQYHKRMLQQKLAEQIKGKV